jgi:hypothetical protein
MVLKAICPFTGFGGLVKDREWRMQTVYCSCSTLIQPCTDKFLSSMILWCFIQCSEHNQLVTWIKNWFKKKKAVWNIPIWCDSQNQKCSFKCYFKCILLEYLWKSHIKPCRWIQGIKPEFLCPWEEKEFFSFFFFFLPGRLMVFNM